MYGTQKQVEEDALARWDKKKIWLTYDTLRNMTNMLNKDSKGILRSKD